MGSIVPSKWDAAEVCNRAECSDEARRLLQAHLRPEEFLKRLDAQQLFADAIRFTAYALPAREAVWWGCLSAWSIYRPKPPAKIAAALDAVVAWIQQPGEETRRAAGAVADVAGVDTPAGGLAAAIFLSGDNIAPLKQPEVKPKPFLWSKVLAGAVAAAARQVPPDKKKQCERQFLTLALDVIEGRTHWDPRESLGEKIMRRRRS